MGKRCRESVRGCLILAAALAGAALAPRPARPCACGCDVFEVGTSSMFPTQAGGMAFIEFDYQDQNRNWSGPSSSPADNNDDKKIQTHFYNVGYQRMFNRRWGAMAEIPYWNRHFQTIGDGGRLAEFGHSAAGDIRLRVLYTGFSPDMSTGLSFGLKLPSGDHTYPNFDPDTEIGTGSTDLLLGAHHLGRISGGNWDCFVNAMGEQPVRHLSYYRPGGQADAAAGAYYNGWNLGSVKIAPLAQLIGSFRGSDSGSLALPADTGYGRLLVAPGAEIRWDRIRLYTDVGFPVLQNVRGHQLVASELFKLNLSYDL